MKKFTELIRLIFLIFLNGCFTPGSTGITKDESEKNPKLPTMEDAWSFATKKDATGAKYEKVDKALDKEILSNNHEEKSAPDLLWSIKSFDEAQKALNKGYITQSERFYFQQLSQNDHDVDALLGMAQVAIARGEYSYARDSLNVASSQLRTSFDLGETRNALLGFLQAKIQLALGETKVGRLSLINLKSRYPKMEEIYLALAECYFDEDLPKVALEVILSGIDEVGDRPSFLIAEVLALIGIGDLLSAELLVNQILTESVQSTSSESWLSTISSDKFWQLVQAMISLQRLDEVELLIKEGSRFFPLTYRQHLARAQYFEKLSYFSEMEEELQRALKMDQQAIEARLLLAKLYSTVLSRRSDSLRFAEEAKLFARYRPKYLRLAEVYLGSTSPHTGNILP